MLGAVRSDKACSAITQFFAETAFENVIIIDDHTNRVAEFEHHEWRRLLAAGFDDSIPIHLAIPAYIRMAEMIRTPARMTLKSRFSRIRSEYDQTGRRLVRTSIQPSGHPSLPACGLIMAGGFGRRLGELTRVVPKPMLDLVGKPIAEHLVDNMVENAIHDIYMSVFHLKDAVKSYFGSGSGFGANIRYLEETHPLGTAGCLSLLPKSLNKPLLIVNGDVVTNAQFGRLIEFHAASGLDVTMSVKPHAQQIPFGVVEHVDGMVMRIREKPKIVHMINVAIYVLSPNVLPHIPPNTAIDMPTLIESIIPLGYKVGAFPLVEDWIDVGTVPELERARSKLTAGQGRRSLRASGGDLIHLNGKREVG